MFPRQPSLIADLGGDRGSAAFLVGCLNHVSRRNDNALVENFEQFLRRIDASAQSKPDHLANLLCRSKMTNPGSKFAAAIVELNSRSLLLLVMGAAINREAELYDRNVAIKSLAHVVRTIAC